MFSRIFRLNRTDHQIVSKMSTDGSELQKACFGMGCFWGGEASFGVAKGVVTTKVGYTGGTSVNPSYYKLGDHTEAVEVQYDPKLTTYENMLAVFFKHHNPFVKHKRQYMSAIFYENDEQKVKAEEAMKQESNQSARPLQTQLLPASTFYDAEDYHQKFALRKHPKLLHELKLNDKLIKSEMIAARLNGYLNGFGSLAMFEQEAPSLNLSPQVLQYLRHAIPNAVTYC